MSDILVVHVLGLRCRQRGLACANNHLAHDNKTLTRHRPIKPLTGDSTSPRRRARTRPDASAQARAPIADASILSTNHPVVAVIDDDPGMLNGMRRLLSTHGFDAELYDSSVKFLDAVTTTRAICLILDIQLGDSCGVEFARQLASLGITFPIIFMTGGDKEESEKRARETGCVAFFRKPFSAYLLIEALNDLPNSYLGIQSAK